MTLVPDPAPRAGVFVRSDQWSFVRVGVPSLFVTPGRKPGMDEAELEKRRKWGRERYHSPKDEWDASWLLGGHGALRAAAVPRRAPRGRRRRERPAWNKGDFFERFVQPPRPARR